ncbi:MAG TPA: DHHA1 domain-containing protein, partial [Thermomicrobiales bacterium]|nr:DHHA1 domain-containing protein [Thermomicrobiales bacterium]
VNFLAGTIGARASAILYLESWGWRVSMRTLANDVNVAEILRHFNGGGHPRAAGARLAPGEAARDHFLAQVARALEPPGGSPGAGGNRGPTV